MMPTPRCHYWGDEENRETPCADGCCHYVRDPELDTETHMAFACELDAASKPYELVEPEPIMPWE